MLFNETINSHYNSCFINWDVIFSSDYPDESFACVGLSPDRLYNLFVDLCCSFSNSVIINDSNYKAQIFLEIYLVPSQH